MIDIMSSTNNKTSGLEFLKLTAKYIRGGAIDYVKSSMRTTTTTISDARSTLHEFNSKMKTTTSDILPKLKQLRNQTNVRSLMNWFTSKEDEYNDSYSSDGFDEWDDGTSGFDIAESQISESKANANQISGAIVESVHKSVESQISMTSNILDSLNKQSAIISAGFENSNKRIDTLIEILTKNTSAIIETVSNMNESQSDKMVSRGTFDLSEYKNIIKSNFENSELGLASNMAKTFIQTLSFGGNKINPSIAVSMLMSHVIDKFAPKLNKNLSELDNMINDTIMGSLISLGNNRGSNNNEVTRTLSKIFGIDASKKEVNTSKSTLTLKSTPFDTITKEAITSAIPGYLRKILVAVGGNDEIYDYKTRSFRSKQSISNDFTDEATSNTYGSLGRSSEKIKNKLGDDSWTNMTYDLLMNHLENEIGAYGNAENIVSKLNDSKFVENLILNKLIGSNASDIDKTNAKIFANRLSSINDDRTYRSMVTQAATNNTKRNISLPKYIEEADKYNMDLSYIKDDKNIDTSYIKKLYGRNDINDDKSSMSISNDNNRLSGGVNYTNKALYEIFKRLDTGINVYQVGSSNKQKYPYRKFGNKHLKEPDGYKSPSTNYTENNNSSRQEIISDISNSSTYDNQNNLLRNNIDSDQEDLSKGKRFIRWGRHRGSQLFNAILHGSPSNIRAILADSILDISDITQDSVKSNISKINDKFGNISGYIKHKIFGNEYSYTETDPSTGKKIINTIGKNEKGGISGFIKDKISSMFEISKEKGSKWFSEVSGYFDYGDKKEGNKVINKRKKLLHASIGAMTGAGILGGPVGVIMGAIAGNAIGDIPDINNKIKEMLFGKDNETGKPTGYINRVADSIMSPIQYQTSKLLNFSGDKLKKNIFGPLSDLGFVLRNRITSEVSSTFNKFFTKTLNVGAKAIGGLSKLGGKIFGSILNTKGGILRANIGVGTGIAGWGINRLNDILSVGSPGLHKELSERRKNRNKEIKENSERIGSYKEWRKNKWLRNNDSGNSSKLEEYTKEQIISTKVIESTNSEIVSNTNRTVELLNDIKNSITNNNPIGSDKINNDSSIKNNENNVIQLPVKPNDIEKEDNKNYGKTLISAGTTAAALSGFDNSEIKDIEDISESTNRGESKKSIFNKFKDILKKNRDDKDSNDKESDKKSESFISKLFSGIGTLASKYWPYILGGFLLLSKNFRNSMMDVGSLLLDKLPNVFKSISSMGESINNSIENKAYGADTVKDEVTGSNKSVVSAETHAEHLKDGALKTALNSTIDPLRMAKDQLLVTSARKGIRLGASTIKAMGITGTVGGKVINNLARTGIAASQTASYISNYGLNGSMSAFKYFRSEATSTAGNSMVSGSSNLSGAASNVKNQFQSFKGNIKLTGNTIKNWGTSSQANRLTSLKNISNAFSGLGTGIAGEFGASLGWDYMETSKNSNIVGDYGIGKNAGGFVKTSNKTKTGTVIVSSIASTAVAGSALGSQITAALAAITGTAGATASTGIGAPVGLALLIIAGIITITASLSALVNWITGLITDGSDRDYSIRSNASKMQGVIDGRVSYVNGKENPIYVYCGRESDRVLGLTKGLNIADPDIVFGRYFKTIVDGLVSSPGSEVLLYDWINNMAVQGVPFACYVAGDSDDAKASGPQANTNSTGTPPIDHKGLLGGQYTRVKKSTVEKNKESIFNDIMLNIDRNNPELKWSISDLEEVYKYGKETVEALKRKGILDNSGKVNTSIFKGKPNSTENSSGWKCLKELCKEKGTYFLTRCLVYINSKIEADKKTGQQWLELRKDDLVTLLEDLKDVIWNEHKSLISDMKNQGMSESEIDKYFQDSIDPKGKKANESSGMSIAEDPILSTISNDIKSKDVNDIRQEIQYIGAAYAYSHPSYLEKWASKNRGSTEFSVDDISNISKWNKFTTDKRKKKSLRSKMKGAALAFGQQVGDIYNLLPQFDWSKNGKIYGNDSKSADKYGAAFVLRGQKKKAGEGILDKIFESNNDYTPDEVHDQMYGRITHGKGAESSTINGQDLTIGGNGVIARIADKITTYGSASGQKLGNGDYTTASWRNVLLNIPAIQPSNLPGLENYKDPTNNNEGIGGPEESTTISSDKNNSETSSIGNISNSQQKIVQSGGNPLINKSYKITSSFGATAGRPHSGAHKGVDLVPSDGSGISEVGSRFNGTVLSVKDNVPDSVHAKKINGSWKFPYDSSMSTGNMVTIKTDDGMVVKNMHLKAGSIPNNIKPGARIGIGDRIGTMGTTGWSTGNHLHYEFRDPNNNLIDPTSSLSGPTNWKPNSSIPTYTSGVNENDTINNASSGSTSTEISTNESGPLAILINNLKNVGSTFLNKITGGLLGSNNTMGNESSSLSVSSGSSITSSSMTSGSYISTVSNNKQEATDPSTINGSNSDKVFKKLKSLGYSDAAAAGVLGTWQEESHNDSKTVEGNYLKGYPGYNSVMNNNKSMNEYTTGVLFPAYKNSNLNIAKDQYLGADGNYYPGIGLAQWTGPRHYNLKKHSDSLNKDWRDMNTQVEYMDVEKNSRRLDDSFKQIKDPSQAAEQFARNFEGTNISSWINKRISNAKSFYEKYKGTSGNDENNSKISDPLSNTDGTGGQVEDNTKTNSKINLSTNFNKEQHSTIESNNNPHIISKKETPVQNNISISTPEILNLLKDVILELKLISGNTEMSSLLLKNIDETGVVDKDLRSQLSSLSSKKARTSKVPYTRGPNYSSNNRMITSMIRP